MIGRRTLRRFVALVATLAIVTAQTVAAAHACARTSTRPADAAVGQICPEHGGRADGASSGNVDANLCEVHCQNASVPVGAMPVYAPAPDAAIPVPEPLASSAGVPAAAPGAKGAAPPARSRYCRLQL